MTVASLRRRSAVLALAAVALPAAGAVPAAAQEDPRRGFEIRNIGAVYLDDVHAGVGGERDVDLYLRVLTEHGDPVEHLRARDLLIYEDAEPIENLTVEPLVQTRRGLAAVLAIDVSRTMREPFEHVRQAALEFLERLEPADSVAVVKFAGHVDVVAGFDASRASVQTAIEQLSIDEESLGTALNDGVYRALELIREDPRVPRRAIAVVLSDGGDSGPPGGLERVIGLAEGSERRPRVLVFTIGYARFGLEGLDVMRELATKTGGKFELARTSERIADFFSTVAYGMQRSYVARFETGLDAGAHRIEVCVEVCDEGHRANALAIYPELPTAIWPYALALAALALGGAVAFLVARGGAPGRLVYVGGPQAGEAVPLRRGRVRLGGLPENDLVVSSPAASRYHAEIFVSRGGAEIRDLHSTNGTHVNGQAVQSASLRPGDRIRIADVDLVYER